MKQELSWKFLLVFIVPEGIIQVGGERSLMVFPHCEPYELQDQSSRLMCLMKLFHECHEYNKLPSDLIGSKGHLI